MSCETSVKLKWNKEVFNLVFPVGATIYDAKLRIAELTGVDPSNQKLVGLGHGPKSKIDSTLLHELRLKPETKVIATLARVLGCCAFVCVASRCVASKSRSDLHVAGGVYVLYV